MTMQSIPVSVSDAAGEMVGLSPGQSRSFARQVMADTFAGWRARAGAAWVIVLAAVAVLAPFLASSQPYLVKVDGRWSSPLLSHLTVTDALLVVVAVAVVIAMRVGWRFRWRVLLVAWMLAVASPVTIWLVHPPETVVYEEYRQLEREGRVQYMLRAPVAYSPTDRQRDMSGAERLPPSWQHLLGTEGDGADVLSRMIHASRIALAIGFISTGISVIIGIMIGGVMGYFAGRVDMIGMRLIEIFEAIPSLFLLIMFVAFYGRSLYMMMAIIGLVSWTRDARFIRAEFLRLRKQDFVQAAIASGLPLRSILFRHMLPNGIAPVLVSASFGIASAILAESTLSFLGLGLIDEPSWGQMLNQARSVGGTFIWWLALFPGMAIFLTVFAYNLIGEALRDAIDPKLRGAR